MTLPDSLRRAIRTFVQAWTGTFLAMWIGPTVVGDLPDRDFVGRVVIASTVAGVVALVTLVHNWSEDNTSFPTVLKN